MSAQQELQRLIEVLSERECAQLLQLVQPIAEGERFWEDDAAILYNEQVRSRSFEALRDQVAARASELSAGAEASIFAPIPITKTYAGARQVRLPKPVALHAELSAVVLQRRSRRVYRRAQIALGQLSTLLQHTCGVTGFTAGYGYDRLPLRSFPSCGALQAPEVYLLVRAVGNLEPGVYHYRPLDHALELLGTADGGELRQAVIAGQQSLQEAAVVWIITGCYERLRWKYGPRAYRLMCIEVGFLAENLCMAAEALGLGACAFDGFVDAVIEQLIGVNGKDEIALLLVAVGVPAERTA